MSRSGRAQDRPGWDASASTGGIDARVGGCPPQRSVHQPGGGGWQARPGRSRFALQAGDGGGSATTRRVPGSRDRRGTNTIQMAILAGVMLVVVFTVVQAWLYYAGRNAAQSSAAACAEHVRGQHVGASDGRASADSVLAQSGAVSDWQVDISNGARTVSCTVTARAHGLGVPGLSSIRQTATMPKERTT